MKILIAILVLVLFSNIAIAQIVEKPTLEILGTYSSIDQSIGGVYDTKSKPTITGIDLIFESPISKKVEFVGKAGFGSYGGSHKTGVLSSEKITGSVIDVSVGVKIEF